VGQDYWNEWTCKCGRRLRAFFKADAVPGDHFQEHTVNCPDCKELKQFIPAPYRLDKQEEGSSWTTVWVK